MREEEKYNRGIFLFLRAMTCVRNMIELTESFRLLVNIYLFNYSFLIIIKRTLI